MKRYVAKLSDEERGRLNTLIHAGKHSARLLTKARILLKADASEAGEGWSDSQIAAALDTSVDTVARTRHQLVEEGLEAVLTRKRSPAYPPTNRQFVLRSIYTVSHWKAEWRIHAPRWLPAELPLMIEAAAQCAWSTDRGQPIFAGIIAALLADRIILPVATLRR